MLITRASHITMVHSEDWVRYADGEGIKRSNVENYKASQRTWLLDSQHAVKYVTQQKFTSARALYNTLKTYNVFKLWEDFFGSWTDFLSPTLNNAHALHNMHALAVMVDVNFKVGHPKKLVGIAILTLCKFCVGLLAPSENKSVARWLVCNTIANLIAGVCEAYVSKTEDRCKYLCDMMCTIIFQS
jgi:hypothetical protein